MKTKFSTYTTSKQLFFLITVAFAVVVMVLLYSCCLAKSNEIIPIVYQLNDEKFDEGNDRKNAAFIVISAEIYLHEIRLAQLAQARAKQIDVRELGKINETYNTQKLIALIKLAKAKSISIPTSSNRKNEKIYVELSNQTMNSFDRNYCNIIVKNHTKSIHFFETIVSESTDADIREWATQSLSEMDKQLSNAAICRRNCITRIAF